MKVRQHNTTQHNLFSTHQYYILSYTLAHQHLYNTTHPFTSYHIPSHIIPLYSCDFALEILQQKHTLTMLSVLGDMQRLQDKHQHHQHHHQQINTYYTNYTSNITSLHFKDLHTETFVSIVITQHNACKCQQKVEVK